MSAFSSAAFLSSMTPSGRPLTKMTTSGRRLCWPSITVNWLTAASRYFPARRNPKVGQFARRWFRPCAAFNGIPFTSNRWNSRLSVINEVPCGTVIFRNASSSASAGNVGFSFRRAMRRRLTELRRSRIALGTGSPGAISGPWPIRSRVL